MAATKAFDKILDCVKSSNLNFCLQLSPFSANISLKKTLIKDKAGFYLNPPEEPDLSLPKKHGLVDVEKAKKITELEHIIADLRVQLEESQTDREHAYETINKLKGELFIKLENTETEQVAKEEAFADQLKKKTLEINILKEEKQKLKNQNDNLQMSLQNSKSTATRLNKEVNENKRIHDKASEQTVKIHKSEIKYWKKELGLEKSQRIKAERKLAIIEKELSKPQHAVSCQTNQTPDTPYTVTDALPPIFGSKLCHRSKAVKFFSRSLPNLSTISWVRVTEEDIQENEAEQALNNQYDRQVDEFYIDAKKKAEAVRQVYEENYIEKLFGEDS